MAARTKTPQFLPWASKRESDSLSGARKEGHAGVRRRIPWRLATKEINMCQRVTCPSCGKPTFVGCGMHVEQVLGDVRPADRCRCREKAAGASPGAAASPLARPDASASVKPGK